MRRLVEPFVVLVLVCSYIPAWATAVMVGGTRALLLGGVPAAAYLMLVGWLRWRRPDLRLPGRAEIRHCTTQELCRAWRRSETIMRSTWAAAPATRVRLVSLRHAYLDALENRDPVGFALWISLSSPGRVPPDTYIGCAGRAVGEEY